jgi:hypothetical protein
MSYSTASPLGLLGFLKQSSCLNCRVILLLAWVVNSGEFDSLLPAACLLASFVSFLVVPAPRLVSFSGSLSLCLQSVLCLILKLKFVIKAFAKYLVVLLTHLFVT